MLNRDVQKVLEFIIEYKPPLKVDPLFTESSSIVAYGSATGGKPIKFLLTPESLQNVKDVRFF